MWFIPVASSASACDGEPGLATTGQTTARAAHREAGAGRASAALSRVSSTARSVALLMTPLKADNVSCAASTGMSGQSATRWGPEQSQQAGGARAASTADDCESRAASLDMALVKSRTSSLWMTASSLGEGEASGIPTSPAGLLPGGDRRRPHASCGAARRATACSWTSKPQDRRLA